MKKLFAISISFSVTLALLGGCGKDGGLGSLFQLTGAPLKGQIAGKAWTYRFGTAVQPAGSQTWAVALYDKEPAADPCTKSSSFKPGETVHYVHFFVKDLKVGALDFTLGSGKGSVSLIKRLTTGTGISAEASAAFGSGEITSVTEDTFKGTLNVSADDRNKVNGQFAVKLCR